ncbi:MAG: hypothetical protein LIQ30_04550 [Planctomycetes bacterium]|nr:hypothetical protein [Planctomycetota bacterium]
MTTRLEDVIRDAALKNRVGLREDDPVMVLVTIMNRIAEDQTANSTAAMENHRTIFQEIALAWRTDATERANQILNAALDAGRKAMAKGMTEGGTKVMALVRDETESMLSEMAAASARMERAMEAHRKWVVWMSVANSAVLIIALAVMALR